MNATETSDDVPGFAPMAERTPRVVALSGGGSGIGRAVARGLAAAGHPVAILGRRQAALEETAHGHAGISVVPADIADSAAAAAAIALIEDTVGPVDIAIANAAIHPKGHFLDQDPDTFAQTLRINVEGVANFIRPVLPGMLARNCGRVVVMGSLADMNPLPGSVAYSVSKGALHTLVRGLAAEIDPVRYPNVLINEMSPGATRSGMGPTGGRPPEAALAGVQALIDLPAGTRSGRFFQDGREIRLGESWKGAVKRLLGLRK